MRAEWLLAATLLASAPATAQTNDYSVRNPEDIRRSLDRVMAREEFERLRESPKTDAPEEHWLERFLDWLDEQFEDTPTPLAASPTSPVADTGLRIGAGLLVLAALAFLIRSMWHTTREDSRSRPVGEQLLVAGPRAPGELPPETYRERAEKLDARGEHGAAIRALLLATMSSLERSGRIRHRGGLTVRDYVRASTRAQRSEILEVTSTFERVFFGRRAATRDSFRRCLRAIDRLGLASKRPEGDAPA